MNLQIKQNNKEELTKEEKEIETYDSLIASIFDSFKLPIKYLHSSSTSSVYKLKESIISDLELCQTVDNNNLPCMYDYLLDTNISEINSDLIPYLNKYKKKYYEIISNNYTTDIDFLSNYQIYFKHNVFQLDDSNIELTISISKIWNEIKYNKYFKETYYYIEWDYLEFMNKSETYLQIVNTLNLASPIITLLSPLMIFIAPFYVLQTLGIKMSIQIYITTLKYVLNMQLNTIRKLISKNVSISDKVYIIMSFAYYIYVTYHNIMNYFNFNKKMERIYDFFNIINQFLVSIERKMHIYIENIKKIENNENNILKENAHNTFNAILINKHSSTIKWIENISKIQGKWSILKTNEIGKVMCEFYKYHNSKEHNEHMLYLIGLSGYFNFMSNINVLYLNKQISTCIFKDDKTTIVNNYYAPLIKQSNIVKNTIKLKQNLIISGPNASGKTTIMKSVFLNIIFSQQFGIGFYDSKTKINVFDYLHCYLNIPDTSGRDSLFQAEARRCKEIIDEVKNNSKKHFIIFDELFSGTNPDEAVKTSLALITYLHNKSNVKFMLTTHYNNICKKVKSLKNIKNKKMEIIRKKSVNNNNDIIDNSIIHTKREIDEIIYTYKLKKGISKEKGGFNVLKDMGYPKEIYELNN